MNLSKYLLGASAVIGTSADLIAIGLFLKNLYYGVVPLNIESGLPWIFIILLIFLFSTLMYNLANTGSDVLNVIVEIFSWLYVILAALLFTVISKQFITEANYGIYDYFGYIFLIILIAGLGFVTVTSNSIKMTFAFRNFSIPFLLVGLYQVILWVSLCLNPQALVFNLHSLGNALLLVVVGGFVIFCTEY